MMKKVMKINNIDIAKRRLMFSVAEDSYFLTYNIILILGILQCIEKHYLKDSKKIALLVTIIEKKENIRVVRKVLNNSKIDNYDKKILYDMFYNSKLKGRSVISIIFSLDKKGIIKVKKNRKTIDIALAQDNIYKKIISEKMFEEDFEIYKEIFSKVKQIKSIVADTFTDIIFGGIKEEVWDI